MKRGLFIAVEGIDGAGSTTQAKELCAFFKTKGQGAHLTCEPSTWPVGVFIRQLLREKSEGSHYWQHILALSFAADRLYHYEHEIAPKLQEGIHVVSDRYVLSSYVYQGLSLPQQWIEELNQHAPKANVTILIDSSADVAEHRRTERGGAQEVFDSNELQRRVRERYLHLSKSMKAIVVDGSAERNVVTERMLFAFCESFPEFKSCG